MNAVFLVIVYYLYFRYTEPGASDQSVILNTCIADLESYNSKVYSS